MDKKELLKRWALAYTEPSLFYVPWKKSKKKPYYEYVTIVFKYAIPTFSSKDWARVPVFGVYLVNDDKSETLVYSTALYDEDNHLIRNGIVTDSTSYFFISGDHGRTNRALVKEGNFKIRMLCSGSGMITNSVYEWDFEVKRGTSGSTIYDNGYYEYSYRTITIDPFKGNKYLEIEYEPTLVKEYAMSEFIDQHKVVFSTDVFGDSSRRRWAYDEYFQKKEIVSDFGLSTVSIDAILPDLQDNIYFYDVKIQFNEKFFEYKTNHKTVLSHRGTKKVVNDKLELKGSSKYLEYTNASTMAQYALDYSGIDFDYSYHINSIPSFSRHLTYSGAGVRDGYGGYSCCCSIFDSNSTSVKGQLTCSGNIPSDINSYYTGYKQKVITLYCNRNFLQVKKYDKTYLPYNDNILHVSNRDERFKLFQELEQECRAYFQESLKEHLKTSSSTVNKTQSELSLPLEYIITNVLPDAYKEEYTYYPDEHYDLQFPSQQNDYGMYEISSGEPKTVIRNRFGVDIIDMGIDYTNYEHYEDIDSWIGNTLGNPEIEVYHPEMIPKEKAGET